MNINLIKPNKEKLTSFVSFGASLIIISLLDILSNTFSSEGIIFIFSELPSGQSSNIAHSAHLGGALAGFIVHKLESAGFSIPRFKFASNPKVNINPYSRKESHGTSSYKINFPKASDLEDDVNRILDKINEHGFGSLTKEEKNILEKAKSLFSEKDL